MKREYEFKRNFYYEVERAIEKSHITFLLGPGMCGKTVCMHQLESAVKNAVYVDMKADFESDEQRRKFVNQALEDIANDKDVIYLIDEATYMATLDKDIAKIAGAYSKYVNHNTKFVFSGGQSNALEYWGHLACAGDASFIRTGFLSYPEWLAYKGITEISEETYMDFLLNVREFYDDFIGTKEYLQGCLDEAVVANREAVEYIENNFIIDLNVEMLLDVLYASLIKLHNNTKKDGPARIISEITGGRYKKIKSMTVSERKAAMRFLLNCELITLTYVSDKLTVDPYIVWKFLKASDDINPQIFSKFSLSINYPMFYIDLVKSVLKDKKVSELPRDLLGSIVECHVRSLLPTNGCFEYCNDEGVKIDYVSIYGQGLEISVSNKRMGDVNLRALSEEYRKILLTKNVTDEVEGIKRIPYYKFIYDNSVGKELVEKLKVKQI